MLPLLRYTLDLFSTDAPESPPRDKPASSAPPAPTLVPAPAPALAPVTAPASVPVPLQPAPVFQPGVSLADAAAPARFAHPQANREARLGNALVAYAFARAKRKTIGFVIGPEGLVVRAPRWTPFSEIDAALQEKARWILRKLQESGDRQRQLQSARLVWCDGVELPFLGQTIVVKLDPAHGFSGRGAQLKAAAGEALPRVLHVGLPQSASAEQIRDAVQAWLMRQAQSNFQERMLHFAPLLGVQWKKLRLSSAGTRWGSASADGSIRLNWRLIHLRQPVIDYVVAHELSHLREMNHSASFWSTVATVVPDYQSLRAQLKDDRMPQW